VSLVQQYYPGQEYVDWLCADGYNPTNRDGQPGWPDWQWFDDIYYPIYHSFVDHPEIFGEAPIMIGEFAACEAGPYELPGQTKSAWITNAFERMGSADYARIKVFTWFNIDKECDWRINSSDASLAAFRAAISGPSFVSHPHQTVYLPVVMH
jgi:beta-mannanase